MEHPKNKLDLIKEKIKNKTKPLILELGVKEGKSTKMFLEICDKNDGNLISVDIWDYSQVSNNPKYLLKIKYFHLQVSCKYLLLEMLSYNHVQYQYKQSPALILVFLSLKNHL